MPFEVNLPSSCLFSVVVSRLEKSMIAFNGVRISWLILARNADFSSCVPCCIRPTSSGGLTCSTILNLVIVPLVYYLLHKAMGKLGWNKNTIIELEE